MRKNKKIIFCTHAENKFTIFKQHGLKFAKSQVVDTIIHAENIVEGEPPRMIAQKSFKPGYVLRVIFEETEQFITVITFYPAKRSRYAY
jgi:hypothetical protein